MATKKNEVDATTKDPVDDAEIDAEDSKEARPTKEQFLKAVTEIDEIDEEIETVKKSIADKIEQLNLRRNSASEVARKYIGRKR